MTEKITNAHDKGILADMTKAEKTFFALMTKPMTDKEAARYVVHTHPLKRQPNEKPEDFILRIVRAYDGAKAMLACGTKVPSEREISRLYRTLNKAPD